MEIVKQLKQIVIILLVFAVVNLCLLSFQSYQMTKYGRVVNFSGIVRGASQKLVKNELSNYPKDQEIEKINAIIQGLIKGDKTLDLPLVKNKIFQVKISIVQEKWTDLKAEIIAFREGKSTKQQLLQISEDFWIVTNDATFAAENTASSHIQSLRKLYLVLFLINLTVLTFVWKINKKISLNIKDRIRAEISLKSSEEKFQQLANNINEVFWMTDINFREIIYVSPAYEKIWGKTCESLYLDINQWKNSIYPQDVSFFDRVLENFLINQEGTFYLEYRILSSDNQIYWIHHRGFLIKNIENQAYRIAGIAEDITQKKNIEICLREELKQTIRLQTITNKIRASLEIETILNNTAHILAIKMKIDSCLIYTYIGDDQFQLNLIGTNINKNIRHYDFLNQLDKDDSYLKRIIDEDKAVVINKIEEEPLLISNQHLLQAENIKSLLTIRTSYKQNINGVIELHQYDKIHNWQPKDIKLIEAVASQLGIAIAQANLLAENKKQLEKLNQQNIQLQEKSKQAEAANKAKTNFLANMSHEIRTPLNAILGFSDLLSQKIIDPENVNHLQSIIFSSNNLLALINDIFELIRLESGIVKVESETVNLTEIIRQIYYKFSEKANQKNIKLIVNLNKNIPDILEFDKLKLYQIINNLLSNAIKFTKLGSVKVDVWANYFQSDLKTRQENCSIVIRIKDTGIGISQEKQKIIFDRFTQVSQETNREYEGIGLGLTLTQKMIQLLEGNLKLESELEKGTTITVTLPHLNIIQLSNQKALNLITETQLTTQEQKNIGQQKKLVLSNYQNS